MPDETITTATNVPNTVPLSSVEQGRRVRFIAVSSGRGIQARLTAMGLAPGVEVEVLRNSHRGPFIIAIDHNRLVLGRGMAHHILVA